MEFLDQAVALPLHLQDRSEMLAYLRDFPCDRYRLCRTADGFFYFIEKQGPLDGIKQLISAGQVWEDYFIDLMSKHIKPGSSVIDAGAYIGTHSLAMSKLTGRRGRVYAFEPQKKVFRELAHNLIENDVRNVIPLRFALGDENRIIEMNIPSHGLEAVVQVGKGGDRVELRTLDSFALTNVSFIKIDVEGYEGHVLDGARRTIERNGLPPILIEIMNDLEYSRSSPPDEVRAHVESIFNKLEDAGYAVAPLPGRDYLALPAPEYALGSKLTFSDSGSAEPYKSGWWAETEKWGSWTSSHRAALVLPLRRPPMKDLVLTAKTRAYVKDRRPSLKVRIVVNGAPLDRWEFLNDEVIKRKAILPASLCDGNAEKAVLHIVFQIEDPRSPAALGLSGDERLLGLGFVELIVREIGK